MKSTIKKRMFKAVTKLKKGWGHIEPFVKGIVLVEKAIKVILELAKLARWLLV